MFGEFEEFVGEFARSGGLGGLGGGGVVSGTLGGTGSGSHSVSFTSLAWLLLFSSISPGIFSGTTNGSLLLAPVLLKLVASGSSCLGWSFGGGSSPVLDLLFYLGLLWAHSWS